MEIYLFCFPNLLVYVKVSGAVWFGMCLTCGCTVIILYFTLRVDAIVRHFNGCLFSRLTFEWRVTIQFPFDDFVSIVFHSLAPSHSIAFGLLAVDMLVCAIARLNLRMLFAPERKEKKKNWTALRHTHTHSGAPIQIHILDEWKRTCYTLLIWQTVDKWERW